MTKFVLLLGLCCSMALGATAQHKAIVGSADPDATEASVQAALESLAEVESVYRINAIGDGRSISAFGVVYGDEGARVQTLRRIADIGMIGHPIENEDECALSVFNRKDQTAVKALDTNPILRVYQEAEEDLKESTAILAALESEELLLSNLLLAAKDEVAARLKMYTAQRELVEKARSVYQAAYETMRATPNRTNFIALLRATVDVQIAVRAAAETQAALQLAQSEAKGLEQDLLQTQERKRDAKTKVFQSQSDLNTASRALDAAWDAVSDATLADIVALAEQVAQDAHDTAAVLGALAGHLEQVRAVLSGHSGGWSFWGDDNGEIPFDHLAAAMDASDALGLVEAARALPPINPDTAGSNGDEHPAVALMQRIEHAVLKQSANSLALTFGMRIGGAPWHSTVLKALGAAEVICPDSDCLEAIAVLSEDTGYLQVLALQEATQMASRKFQTLSNASRSRHDIAMNSIRNMK